MKYEFSVTLGSPGSKHADCDKCGGSVNWFSGEQPGNCLCGEPLRWTEGPWCKGWVPIKDVVREMVIELALPSDA